MRRAKLIGATLLAIAAGGVGYAVAWAEAEPAHPLKVIKVSAKRFVFTPNTLTLKKGETVDIELSSEDVPMGFNVPDLASRADVLPGTTTHLRLTPQKVGTLVFLCDIFCGSGHEDMSGVITVVE
ncbi:MAG: cytochrome-c oxidase [Nevskia sp.]|nr:cytochrome-c oxidase [Nevskia sp.]